MVGVVPVVEPQTPARALAVGMSEDILSRILIHTTEHSMGAVLLTCKRWHTALQKLMKQAGGRLISWEPWATGLQLKSGQTPVPLQNLSKQIGIRSLVQHPTHLGHITKLWLDDKAAWKSVDVPHVISQIRGLKALKLRGLQFDLRATVVSRPLIALRTLTLLDLNNNALGDQGVLALAIALTRLHRLRSLLLGANDLYANGAKALAAVMPVLPSLTMLALNNNALGVEGARYLAEPLRMLPVLRELFMSRNDLGDVGVHTLVDNWSHSMSLRKLSVDGNNITEAGKTVPTSWEGRVEVVW